MDLYAQGGFRGLYTGFRLHALRDTLVRPSFPLSLAPPASPADVLQPRRERACTSACTTARSTSSRATPTRSATSRSHSRRLPVDPSVRARSLFCVLALTLRDDPDGLDARAQPACRAGPPSTRSTSSRQRCSATPSPTSPTSAHGTSSSACPPAASPSCTEASASLPRASFVPLPLPLGLERFLTFSLSLLVSQAQHLHARHHVDDPREDAHRHRRAHSSPRRRQDRIDDLAPIPLAAASSSRIRSRIPLLQYLLYNTLPPSISSNNSLYTPLARTRIPSLEPLPPPPSPHCIARRTVLSTRPACARARCRRRRLRECACARSCRRRGTRSRGRGRPSARARRR